MIAELPIPLNFRLPEGWVEAPPDEVGASQASFAAVHPASRTDFLAYLTVGGEVREDAKSLREVADQVLATTQRVAESIEVANEIETGDESAPGLTRLTTMRIVVDGTSTEVMQCQVYVTVPDVHEPTKRAILRFDLTATLAQMAQLAPDFEQFVDSVEPRRADPE